MKNDIEKILIDEQKLSSIIDDLAQQITNDYKDSERKLVFVVILKGSIPFATELMKRVTLPLEIEVMKVSSYGAGTKSSGEIRIHTDLLREDLPDCDLLIIEDIVDSGRTLQRLTQLFSNRLAGSVKTCTLLDKPERREVDFVPDYCGTVIPNEFVVGFGLDYDEKYRNLPFVGVLKPEIYL
ncbi:MAG: hypoxanthine phosphoribosyltransferase [Clostridia bacterium]|nr:hypoxanthine phosphoribosyltransferase [Clostridia bacterium]MBQ7380368.1 hypoxanthine phosphoribosyltransferase [Clostridia bacterium]